jgi:LPXTG-site transpeptidase (sortase) family protein
MKITEDDLRNIFSSTDSDFEAPSEEFNFEPNIKVKKVVAKNDEIALKKIRREISVVPKNNLGEKRVKKYSFVDFLLKFSAVVGCLVFCLYILMNYSAFTKQFFWLYYTDYLNQRVPQEKIAATDRTITTTSPDDLVLPSEIPAFNAQTAKNDTLVIDKISLDVPIAWNVANDSIIEKLKDGVVHYENTGLPGGGANIFIVGHSSNYSWINSQYNSVFALLDKMIRGDQISIYYKSKKYVYEVIDQKVVSPKNVEVIDSTNEEILTLMTCWPVGTSLNRLVVQAKLLKIDI